MEFNMARNLNSGHIFSHGHVDTDRMDEFYEQYWNIVDINVTWWLFIPVQGLV